EAAEQQISSSSLRKAKDRLGIVSHFIPAKDGHGGSWTWQLPAPSKSDPAELRDAQGDQEEQRVWWWESGMNLARGSAPCEKLAPWSSWASRSIVKRKKAKNSVDANIIAYHNNSDVDDICFNWEKTKMAKEKKKEDNPYKAGAGHSPPCLAGRES